MGIVTDEAGHPAHSALTFPSTPAALAASEIYVLAACADGVHVYDRTTAAWVQSLPYPDGLRTAPGQQLYSAHNPSGSVVLVAGYRRVSFSHLQPAVITSTSIVCAEEQLTSFPARSAPWKPCENRGVIANVACRARAWLLDLLLIA